MFNEVLDTGGEVAVLRSKIEDNKGNTCGYSRLKKTFLAHRL